MTEVGLLIAQVAFLLLLFGFIWLVIRGSLRSLEQRRVAPAPPPVVEPEPVPVPDPEPVPPPEPEPLAVPEPPLAEAPLVAEVPPAPAPEESPPPAPAAGAADKSERSADGGTGAFDMSRDVAPRLVVEAGEGLAVGDEVTLEGGLTIGRAGGSDLCLKDEFASHTHARIVRRGQFFFITDLGSTNGTFLNDRRLETDSQLRVRDVIRLGETRLRYEE